MISSMSDVDANKVAGSYSLIKVFLWAIPIMGFIGTVLGIGTAICLEEFKPRNKFFAKLHSLVQLNITNLAGVPSIVYGIVGLTAFGTMFGLFGSAKEPTFEIGAKHYFQYISEGERCAGQVKRCSARRRTTR